MIKRASRGYLKTMIKRESRGYLKTTIKKASKGYLKTASKRWNNKFKNLLQLRSNKHIPAAKKAQNNKKEVYKLNPLKKALPKNNNKNSSTRFFKSHKTNQMNQEMKTKQIKNLTANQKLPNSLTAITKTS